MRTENIEAIGWALFGIVIVISLAAIVIAVSWAATAGETERLTACVEAGLIWVKGTCI